MTALSARQVERMNKKGRHGLGDGLYLNVSESGRKTWVMRYQMNKVRKDMGLGSYPIVSLAEARRKSLEARRLIYDGLDPIIERRLEACPREALPSPVIVNIKPERITNHMIVPEAIRQIDGLCDISTETRRIGIYFLVLDMEVIYVGQSVNVACRVSRHKPSKNFNKVFYLPWPKDDLDRIETTLIRALQPRENGNYNKKGEIDNKLLETIKL